MKARWGLVLFVPFVISFSLLSLSQYVFVQGSFFVDRGFGRLGDDPTMANYLRVFSDSFYLYILRITVMVSGLAALFTIVMGFPVAYVLARMRSRWSLVILATVVLSSFITIVIKIFGIIVIFQANGPLNRFLVWLGVVAQPITPIGTQGGIVMGLMYFTLGLGVLLMYGVVQTIPRSLEEAAQIHGASRLHVFRRIVLPLSLPGITVGFLMVFNLCMGAFTSAALLGGGRVLTLPVLIQRTVLMEVKYAMGATLAVVLLVSVLLINLASVLVLKRFRAARLLVA
ncbi:MAG: ABC transporter permease [Pseudomonadota bacterium]